MTQRPTQGGPAMPVTPLVAGQPIGPLNPLPTTLSGGDIQIGAVEIKNASDDTRAIVGLDGLEVQGIADRLVPNATESDQALTVDATAGGVQFAAFHADTTHVFWTSETAECRVTFDNSAPTTTNGHAVPAGSNGTWTKALAAAAKFIRTGATSAVISASQLKVG